MTFIGKRIHRALAYAVITFLESTLPALGSDVVDAEAIWINGLTPDLRG